MTLDDPSRILTDCKVRNYRSEFGKKSVGSDAMKAGVIIFDSMDHKENGRMSQFSTHSTFDDVEDGQYEII